MNPARRHNHVSKALWVLAALALGPGLPASAGPASPLLELEQMTYVASRGSSNEVVLDAARARIEPDKDVAHLEEVDAMVAPAGVGKGRLDLTCDRGTFELDSGDFIAEGNVKGTTGDGRRFRTARLRYQHDKGIVITNSPVLIRDQAGTYRGGGFHYWVRENRFRLLGGATVEQDQ